MRPEELASALKGLHDWALDNAPVPEPELPRRLREHLGVAPSGLEIVTRELSSYDQVNVQVAIDALVEEGAISLDVIGLTVEHGFRPRLAELAQRGSALGAEMEPGPVEYASVDVGDRAVSCIRAGLLLVGEGDDRLAVLLTPPEDGEGLQLEAMATRRNYAERWLERVHELMRERNVYRGKVLSFDGGHPFRPSPLTVRRLPEVARANIVLPPGTLERIERHTAGFARHREAMRAHGRHLKRGILLHGPPGTGKTLTIMYLASLMPDRTVILLTGHAMSAIDEACQLARSLDPAMVVLEDVDLVALGRTHYASNPILFELLNAMEGLDEDADIIFALTTNRAELLEPALASRPGRIDLAVELPLPDDDARRRLFELYARGVTLDVASWPALIESTAETSPAFIREVIRQATLRLIEREEAGPVTGDDLLSSVDDLKRQSGRLTASLLGGERPPELDPLAELDDEQPAEGEVVYEDLDDFLDDFPPRGG